MSGTRPCAAAHTIVDLIFEDPINKTRWEDGLILFGEKAGDDAGKYPYTLGFDTSGDSLTPAVYPACVTSVL